MSVAAEQDVTERAAAPREGEAPTAPAESAGRMVAIAFGLMLLALGGAFVLGFFALFFAEISERLAQSAAACLPAACSKGGPSSWRALYGLAGGLGAALVLFFSALARGQTIGHGDRRAGLGDAAITRRALIAALGVAIFAYGAWLSLAYYQARPARVSEILSASPWFILISMMIVVIAAPVSEELFFRGWLWVGLQKHWGVVPTAAFTGVVWAAIHLDGGFWKPILLLPVALILSAARYFGQSVRAPIALHAIYNLIALAPPWHLRWLGLI